MRPPLPRAVLPLRVVRSPNETTAILKVYSERAKTGKSDLTKGRLPGKANEPNGVDVFPH